MSIQKIHKILMWISPREEIHGISCYVSLFCTREERKELFSKLHGALSLIHQYMPVKFAQLKNDTKSVFVFGNPSILGQYISKLKQIEIYDEYALNADTTIEVLASIIVHEAQHARLIRLGIGYEEEIRDRVERLCFKSERIFGYRVPNGEMVIKNANYWLHGDFEGEFSILARRKAELKALDELDCPVWIKKVVKWKVNRKAT